MKLLEKPPFGVFDHMKFEVQNRLPNMAVPGLALTMDKILGKVNSGVFELSVDDRRIIYGQRDKTLAEWSPAVRDMDLSEIAELLFRFPADASSLPRQIESSSSAHPLL